MESPLAQIPRGRRDTPGCLHDDRSGQILFFPGSSEDSFQITKHALTAKARKRGTF